MHKVFIFDMDGVIVDSERAWEKYGDPLFHAYIGRDIAKKMGKIVGMALSTIYEKAVSYGFAGSKKEFYDKHDEWAKLVYTKAFLTPQIDILIDTLLAKDFTLALVSASPPGWIAQVLSRVSFRKSFHSILSLEGHPTLLPKPSPDGYLHTMKLLHASPEQTIILEDSNPGIQAAKASGAFTIGFQQNLLEGYEQKNADVYARNVKDVIKIVENL